MVEYTDPNPFKELHIGHIYSNCVGESLARFFEVMGADVKRADYFGDVGMHVAKSLYGILLKFNIQNPKFKSKEENIGIKKQIDELEKLTLKERVHFLGEAYAMGASKFETDKKSIEEIKDINYYVFISAQKYLAEKYGFTPQVDYKKYLKVDPDKLEMIWMLFSRGRQWSLDYFESIYKRLGTKFDFYYPESAVGEFGYKIVMENVSKGIFEKSDKAIVYKGEKEGLHTRVFINSLGLPTYEAKELGLAMKKFMDFEYDYSFIITGKEINEYFDVLMNVLSKVNDKLFRKNIHIGHGMVRLPKGKMSSRTGQILTAQWLLDEVKAKIAKIVEENGMGQSAEEAGEIAEKSAVAAIKYSLLKVAIPADLVFDFEKSLSFSGESGPYLLYTYARCKSVLRKASDEESQQSSSSAGLSYKPNSEERDTILYLNKYPEVVKKAVQSTAPNLLCTYLYELAQKYNLFYQKHRILESNNSQQITDNKHQSKANSQQLTAEFRLFLTQATSVILKDGLQLLGIETVERM
jgi:arginyl-tRNA synthetase